MKRVLSRIGIIFMLSLGAIFASALLPTQAPQTQTAQAPQTQPTQTAQAPKTTTPLLNSAYAIDPPTESELQPTNPAEETPSTGNETTDPPETPAEEKTETTDADKTKENPNVCQGEAGSISWMLCPLLNASSSLVDKIYGFINQILIIQPISTNHDSAIYKVWKKACEVANIIFAIFIIIVIYSQITGLGVNNYGIKRVLPRIIIAAILVNLSFFISSILVDLSNLIGYGLVDFFTKIQTDIQLSDDPFRDITWSQLFGAFTGGTALGFIAIAGMGGIGAALWMFAIVLFGAVIAVIIGLIMIGLRQGVVLVLIMASPLAFIAYLLPNTEKWFQKWKTILTQMLIFYPMFAFLYGASKLAGWAIISTANKNPLFVILGFAVQVMPLILSISLLKMSDTILGGISRTLTNFTNPLRKSFAGYALSHVEAQRRQHLANNHVLTGARLQNYLAYRQKRREAEIDDLKEITEGRVLERVYKHRSSNRGIGADGKDTWRSSPNHSTRIAKTARLQSTATSAAQLNFTNTLSEYGNVFSSNSNAKALGAAHGEAYLNIMSQQFRAENIAQDDQKFLLDRYMSAAKNYKTNPREYNRLIGGATGKLGHSGETTILGQVIKRSSEIEERRRAEARIVTTKFGYSKSDYRGMILDKAHIGDDGFECDENGNKIEDSQYRYFIDKDGNDTSKRHQPWGKYIGVHKKTGVEITKEEYDKLDSKELRNYKKVKFMEITDDDEGIVQRVYDDDAGYMKEMLRKDIAIGDPINRRYATEVGLKIPDRVIDRLREKYPEVDWSNIDKDSNKTGILRRYHSTIAGALQETGYSEHASEFTAMLNAQLDRGYIKSIGQRNLAGLDSIWKAAKTGKIVLNDASILQDWIKILSCVYSEEEGERFEDYFPDTDILLYQNVNGEPLKGLRHFEKDENGNFKKDSDGKLIPILDENKKPTWIEIARNREDLDLDDKRNFIKHRMIPETAKKLYGALNRSISQGALDGMKPDGADALVKLVDKLGELNKKHNIDPATPFEDRLNDKVDIFDAPDPKEIKRRAEHHINDAINNIPDYREKREERERRSQNPSGNYSGGKNINSGSNYSGIGNPDDDFGGTSKFNRDLRAAEYDEPYANVPYDTVVRDVEDIFQGLTSDFATVSQTIRSYFSNHSPLSDPDTYNALESAITSIQLSNYERSTASVINNTTDLDRDRSLIDRLYSDVINIIDGVYGRL